MSVNPQQSTEHYHLHVQRTQAQHMQDVQDVQDLHEPVWAWVLYLSVISAAGLLVLAIADYAGRTGSQWAQALLWTGLLITAAPTMYRIFSSQPTRNERIALLVMLGLSLYVFKVLEYPLQFTFFDELVHWRTAEDILATGHLFRPNPLLPASPFYPGLEILTDALASVTGLSIFASGIMVIGTARLLLVLALFLFYERVGGDPRVAGIATMLYMTNPHFLYFDAQFAYESLALPLAIFVLLLLSWRLHGKRSSTNTPLLLTAMMTVDVVVISHHVTSYMLVGFLVLWSSVFLFRRLTYLKQHELHASPVGLTLFSVLAVSSWLLSAGSIAVGYLGFLAPSITSSLVRLVLHQEGGRQFFVSGTGELAPLWERVNGFGAEVLILVIMPLGLWCIWKRQRHTSLSVVLALGALAFPASLMVHLTAAGSEAAVRSTAFVFVPLGYVLALGFIELRYVLTLSVTGLPIRVRNWRIPNCAYAIAIWLVAVMIFTGGVVSGWGPAWNRVPGPYRVSGDAQSVDAQSLAAAEWAQACLGGHHRVTADRVNGALMAAYGDQDVVTAVKLTPPNQTDVAVLYFSKYFDQTDQEILKRGDIEYVIVDHRLSSGLPQEGVYFGPGEPDLQPDNLRHSKPLDPAALAKFDSVPTLSRVFDSGDIVIYRVQTGDLGKGACP